MKRVIKIVTISISILLILTMLSFGVYLLAIPSVRLDTEALNGVNSVTRYVDASGREIPGVITGRNATSVQIADLSEQTLNAFICTEDKRFYRHNGIDFRRIASAFLNNLIQGASAQGASTITQQLAKNTHLSNQKTLTRKIQELRLARAIERQYSKREILEMYLNAIYFGHNVYGLESASRYFFGISAKDLSVDQAATLAAVINAPSRYSPIKHPEAAKNRRDLVLNNMVKQKKLSESEYSNAIAREIIVKQSNSDSSYYLACVQREAKEIYGDIAGCTIYTGYQENAQHNLIDALSLAGDARAKGVVCDHNGSIVASYSEDLSTAGLKRQPGSAIKPISVYAPAIEKGIIAPATPVLDEPTDFDGYKPGNFGGGSAGWISARQALATSNNVAAVKILEMTGVDYAFEFAKRAGLPLVEDDKRLPMALGGLTFGVTAEQLASSYSSLSGNGSAVQSRYIRRIENSEGKVVYRQSAFPISVMSRDTAALVRDMMQTCAKTGTANALRELPFDVAAKTGTVGAEDRRYNTDAYCAGLTSQNAFCIWIGSDGERLLPSSVRGGTLPAQIARQLLNNLYEAPPVNFENDLRIVDLDADAYNKEHILVEAPDFLPEKDVISEKFGFRYLPAHPRIVVPTLDVRREKERFMLKVTGDRYADYQIIRQTPLEISVIPIGKLSEGNAMIYDEGNYGLLWSYRVIALYPDGSRQISDPVQVVGIA